MTISNLSDIPAVAEYLRRIGATARGMRTAHVREREGRYSREIAVIRLGEDGQIAVSSHSGEDVTSYLPDDKERHEIAIEAKAARWPEHKLCATIRNAPSMISDADPADLFEFRDDDNNIVMLQVRRDRDDGTKSYVPYTYWDDDQWRMAEPEVLPLWGIDQLKGGTTVFVHEGAKAARTMRGMVEGATPEAKKRLAAHPWGEALRHAAHVGWIGGALAPHRTDWSVLHKFGVGHVIIVADNDDPGHAAVPKIARALRHYPIRVQALRFDERWPVSFDLADPFPPAMFKKSVNAPAKPSDTSPPHPLQRYAGPSLADLTMPATWATRVGQAPPRAGAGRPSSAPVTLRSEFVGQWFVWVGEAKTIFLQRHDPTRFYPDEQLNALARPFSDIPRLSDLFKVQGYDAVVHAVAYEPGQPAVISQAGVRSVNTWVPSRIRPAPGDITLWDQFMDHLFPDKDDRWEVKRWLYTLIARPDVRMKYALLLASTMQGVGKTTFCEVARVLVGERNASAPSAKDVVESAFNSWIGRKRLVFVNEIYEGKSWTAYQKLKSYITDETIEVNEKFVPGYSVRNWAHFILCSNSELALRIENDDRRLLVPTVTEQKQAREFWDRLHDWLDGGGYAIIAQEAANFVTRKDHAVRPGDDAPDTRRKQQMIEDSRSAEERAVADLASAAIAKAAAGGGHVVLVEGDVMGWLRQQMGGEGQGKGAEASARVVRGWLRGAGLHVSEHSARPTVGKGRAYVAATMPLTNKGWPDLKPYRCSPDELGEM